MNGQAPRDIPAATHSGTVEIMGVTLHVHRLTDGRTIIEAADVDALFAAMADGAPMDPDDAESLARVMRGAF